MAYTDGLMVLVPVDGSGDPQTSEVETAAVLAEFLVPSNVTVLEWGVHVTEDCVVHASDPVITLGKRVLSGGTITALQTLTLSSAATLKAGDGSKEAQTAITASTDIDDGDTILANPGALPLTVQSGEFLTFELTTASGSTGGSIIPFAIVRLDGGVDARQTNVWMDVAAL